MPWRTEPVPRNRSGPFGTGNKPPRVEHGNTMPIQDLFTAIKDNDLKNVKRCLKAGADPNAQDELGMTALHEASRTGKTAIVRLLIEHGADPNARWTNNITSLDWACAWGYIAIARLLLDAGADVNARNNDCCTPLHWACLNRHTAIARLLLERGADPGAQDANGETPLEKILQLSFKGYSKHSREELIALFQQFAPEVYFSAFCTANPGPPSP